MSNDVNNPFEIINQPDVELGEIKQISDIMIDLLDKRYVSQNKKILRGVHPKSHGCVHAIFTVNDDVAPIHQVGLFSIPGKKYQAMIRFSNAAAVVAADLQNQENSSRGMAIKVLAVEGDTPFLQDDGGARNQDFLMINTPSFAFVNTPDYLQLNKILLKNNDSADEFFAPLANPATCPHGVIAAFQVVKEIKSIPVANPLAVQYFGAAPFLFGVDRVMKFSVKPVGVLQEQKLATEVSENYLKDALSQRMAEVEPVLFDFMVQVRNKDENDLGIEDATTRWDEAQFPYVALARIIIAAPQLDIFTPENEEACENLAFSPWHSLAAHQPLGSINRLRKDVYTASAIHRKSNL